MLPELSKRALSIDLKGLTLLTLTLFQGSPDIIFYFAVSGLTRYDIRFCFISLQREWAETVMLPELCKRALSIDLKGSFISETYLPVDYILFYYNIFFMFRQREWAETVMLPELCKRALSIDLKERHGAVHMASEVILGLCTECHNGLGSGEKSIYKPNLTPR